VFYPCSTSSCYSSFNPQLKFLKIFFGERSENVVECKLKKHWFEEGEKKIRQEQRKIGEKLRKEGGKREIGGGEE